jgi:hypothetical protein
VRAALSASPACPDVPELAFQAGLAMEWLTELCCTPLFYYRCAASPHPLQTCPPTQRFFCTAAAVSIVQGNL